MEPARLTIVRKHSSVTHLVKNFCDVYTTRQKETTDRPQVGAQYEIVHGQHVFTGQGRTHLHIRNALLRMLCSTQDRSFARDDPYASTDP